MVKFVTLEDYDYHDNKTRCCEKRDKNICVQDWSSFTSEELSPIRTFIENDKGDEFKSFLKKSKITYDEKDDVLLKFAGHELCPYGILGKICNHRASKCAKVLLSHKVGSLMNLNIQNCYGSYPMQDAAISLSACLVKLLLDHGARHDLGSLIQVRITPLEYALESLSCDRNLIHWNSKKSIFKLIITLCLPQMKEALETIDLLAGDLAGSADLTHTIFSAVKRGQVVAVAVLLLVARDRVMLGCSFPGNEVSSGNLLFPESIMNELAMLLNQESSLVGRNEHTRILQLCREKKDLMICILRMIEIFSRAGPALESYLKTRTSDVTNEQVSYHVAKLLREARLILSTEDTDMSDITSSPKPDPMPLNATVNQQGNEEEEDDPEGIWFKPCREQLCHCDMKIPACTTSNLFHRIVGTSFFYNHHRGFSSRAGPASQQPLWTIPRRDICFLSRSPEVLGREEPSDKRSNSKPKSGNWFQLQMSKRGVRSGSILVSALIRRRL